MYLFIYMSENTLFLCSVCLIDKFWIDKHTNFFCECHYDICQGCYDYYYINNSYKCMICKRLDLKKHYDDLYSEFKTIYKTYITLKNHCQCDCKLNKIKLSPFWKISYKNRSLYINCDFIIT